MRRAARVDENQKEIVEGLRKLGCSVALMHAVGEGFPDIQVGYRGVNYLIEIKDGNKIPSARKLTPPQKKIHAEWRGQIAVAKNLQECFEIIGLKISGAAR